MPREDVEILRLFYEAFNRRDFDGALQWVDPEVELYPGVVAPDQDTRYVGRQGVKEFFRIATEAWETVTVKPEEIVETASERILVVDRWLFRGRGGLEIDRELPTVFAFRNGLIVRIDGFTDKARALEAAGLSG